MQDIFIHTENQRLILETVKRFVEAEVKPRAAALDAQQDPAKSFSWEIVEKANTVGIRTMTLDEKWGGLGTDSLTTAMVIEELGIGDIGVSVIFAQTLKIAQIMQKALSAEQQARVMPAFAKDPRGMLAIGITEPDNASNYFLPYPTPFRTNGQKTKGGWIVNGMKHFISNGNRSSFYLLFVQTEKGKPLAEGSTCFLVERDRPGFAIGRVHDKMGERLANNAELIFEDSSSQMKMSSAKSAKASACWLISFRSPTRTPAPPFLALPSLYIRRRSIGRKYVSRAASR